MSTWSAPNLEKPPLIKVSHLMCNDQDRLYAEPYNELEPPSGKSTRKEWFVLLPSNAYVAPVCAYLQSKSIQKWLNHFCEKRRNHWVLKDQTMKYLPIPHLLIRVVNEEIGVPDAHAASVVDDLFYHPERIHRAIQDFNHSEGIERKQEFMANLFVKASEALVHLEKDQARLFSLVHESGEIDWQSFLSILPPSEVISFTRHPGLKMSGGMPPHLPISKINRVKAPANGIVFASETGLNMQVGAVESQLLDILWSQVQTLKYPTWNELTQNIRLPRDLDFARATALEIVEAFTEQTKKRNNLRTILGTLDQWT